MVEVTDIIDLEMEIDIMFCDVGPDRSKTNHSTAGYPDRDTVMFMATRKNVNLCYITITVWEYLQGT